MARQKKDRVELLQRGVRIARRYQQAKCKALRTEGKGRDNHFEEELRAVSPRFDAACRAWYEWYSEFWLNYYPEDNRGLLAPPEDWKTRNY